MVISGIPRSTYYAVLKASQKPDKDSALKAEVAAIAKEHKGRYGYRRITGELHNRGYNVNHKKVARIMKEAGLQSRVRIKKYRSYRGTQSRIAPNLLKRDFCATAPNQKWVTDITEIAAFGMKLYFSPILDLFNGEVISYSINFRPNYDLVDQMLMDAVEFLPTECHPILHSDQGWHYQMSRFKGSLEKYGIIQSMSRKGNCLDNACAESFFANFKSELLYINKFKNIDHMVDEIHDYIRYYNTKRIREKLGWQSPVQYRKEYEKAA